MSIWLVIGAAHNYSWVVLTGIVRRPLTTQLLAIFQLFEQLLKSFGNFLFISSDNLFDNFKLDTKKEILTSIAQCLLTFPILVMSTKSKSIYDGDNPYHFFPPFDYIISRNRNVTSMVHIGPYHKTDFIKSHTSSNTSGYTSSCVPAYAYVQKLFYFFRIKVNNLYLL